MKTVRVPEEDNINPWGRLYKSRGKTVRVPEKDSISPWGRLCKSPRKTIRAPWGRTPSSQGMATRASERNPNFLGKLHQRQRNFTKDRPVTQIIVLSLWTITPPLSTQLFLTQQPKESSVTARRLQSWQSNDAMPGKALTDVAAALSDLADEARGGVAAKSTLAAECRGMGGSGVR